MPILVGTQFIAEREGGGEGENPVSSSPSAGLFIFCLAGGNGVCRKEEKNYSRCARVREAAKKQIRSRRERERERERDRERCPPCKESKVGESG